MKSEKDFEASNRFIFFSRVYFSPFKNTQCPIDDDDDDDDDDDAGDDDDDKMPSDKKKASSVSLFLSHPQNFSLSTLIVGQSLCVCRDNCLSVSPFSQDDGGG